MAEMGVMIAKRKVNTMRRVTGMTCEFGTNPIVETRDPLNQVMTIGYNNVGQPTSVQSPIATEPPMTFAYDTNGNLITTTDPLGNSTQRVYDAVSRLTALTDPRGLITQFRYDGLNRVTEIADARQGLTRFTCDPNGNLLTVTDAKNQTTTYTYDSMDRLETREDALNRQESYQYNPAGNLTQFTDRKNQIASFQYDALNRRTTAMYSDTTTTLTYDAAGRLMRASDSASGAGANDFVYDQLDRLIQEITGQGAVAYQYDVLGRRTQMTANGQQPVTYQYDAASRLIQVAQGVLAVGFGYDNANRRTSLTYPNGTSTSYAYDVASRLANMTHNGPSGLIEGLTYTYDAAGNRTSLTRANGAASLLPAAVASATYDAANEQAQFGGATLTYDQNGNLTHDGTDAYTWDARNRLAGISGGSTASFSYDALGRRGSKTINGVTTSFVYDALDIALEVSGSAVAAGYLRNFTTLDEPFVRQATGSEYYHANELGSTIALTNAMGTMTATYTYDAFGTPLLNGTSSNAYQFTGRENDGTGLHYFRARYYSPKQQRFINRDPVGFSSGGLNLYAYGENSPVRFIDPMGLWTHEVHDYYLKQRFGGAVPQDLLAQIMAGSNYVDSLVLQAPRFSPLHSMSSDVYPTDKEVRKEACDFMRDNMAAFRSSINNNEPARAYYHLGQALHPVMDFTSPVHRGSQYWRPTINVFELWDHRAAENMSKVTPQLESETLALMNAVVSGDYSAVGCGK